MGIAGVPEGNIIIWNFVKKNFGNSQML